jgi:hypothetical protein
MRALNRRDFLRLSALGVAAPLVIGVSRLSPAAAITPTPTATPLPPASKAMRGLYAVMRRNDDAMPDELLKSSLITGITLQFDWSKLQPTPQDFAWDIIDGAIQRAIPAGKKLALRPLAGIGCPSWLYRGGVKKFTFTPQADLYHPLGFGSEVTMPYPWDKTMLDYWEAFIQALGARFDGESTLVRVAVSGPMFQQAETYLPHSEDVLADWKKAGYMLTTIQAAWQKTLDIYANVFHKTPFTLDLNPLPDPIDKTGSTFNGLVPVAIAQYGIKRAPGRFFPAQSDLSDVYPWLPAPLPGPVNQPALYLSYERQEVQIYQFLASVAKLSPIGLMVSESRMSRAADRVKDVLERAKLLRAAYIEIPVAWAIDPDNADALRSVFAAPAG